MHDPKLSCALAIGNAYGNFNHWIVSCDRKWFAIWRRKPISSVHEPLSHTRTLQTNHTLYFQIASFGWIECNNTHTHNYESPKRLWKTGSHSDIRVWFFFLSVSHDCVLFSSLSLFRLAILFSLLLAFCGCCCLPKQKMAWRCSRAIRPSPKSKQRVSISINENRLQRQNWLMITSSHTSHSSFFLCEDLVFSSYFIIDLWSNICIGFRVLWSHKIRIPLQQNVMLIEIWSSHQFKPTTQWHFSTSCTAIECVCMCFNCEITLSNRS